MLRHIFTLVLAIAFASAVTWKATTVTIIYYGFYTLTGLVAIPILYGGDKPFGLELVGIIPSKSKVSALSYRVFWLVMIGLLILGLIGYWDAAASSASYDLIVRNARIAGLIMAIGFSVFLLIDQTHKRPLLSFLLDIRRQVVFGAIEVSDAIKQTERAVVGIDVDEQLRNDISELTPLITHREQVHRELQRAIEEFSRADGSGLSTETTKSRARKTFEPLLEKLKGAVEQADEEARIRRQIHFHIAQIDDDSRESVQEAKELLSRVDDLNDEFQKQSNELSERVKKANETNSADT